MATSRPAQAGRPAAHAHPRPRHKAGQQRLGTLLDQELAPPGHQGLYSWYTRPETAQLAHTRRAGLQRTVCNSSLHVLLIVTLLLKLLIQMFLVNFCML